MAFSRKLSALILLALFVLPSIVVAESTCETEDEDRNSHEALKYKIVALTSILVAGAIGVCIPMLGKFKNSLSPGGNLFFLIKAFAGGVILATGFIHILPDALENLTSPCLNGNIWGNFPFAALFAMLAAIITLLIDGFASDYFLTTDSNDTADVENAGHIGQTNIHSHGTHGHAHGASSYSISDPKTTQLRHRVISKVLELGIVVHSVIIGLSLGASQSPSTIKPLVAAITFHQFFEGMGLGGSLSQANYKNGTYMCMASLFSLTTPLGIVVGILISGVYSESSPTALIVEGILNAAAAGILIYMALVDLLAADFMDPKMQGKIKLKLGGSACLLLGAGLMSLLAIWA